MDTQTEIKLIQEKLDRIERLLIGLSQRGGSRTWVKAKDVMKITGWNAQFMHKARTYGFVQWKKDKKKGFLYLLESINPLLIKTAIPKGAAVT